MRLKDIKLLLNLFILFLINLTLFVEMYYKDNIFLIEDKFLWIFRGSGKITPGRGELRNGFGRTPEVFGCACSNFSLPGFIFFWSLTPILGMPFHEIHTFCHAPTPKFRVTSLIPHDQRQEFIESHHWHSMTSVKDFLI